MIDVVEDSGDRLVIELDPGGPVELNGLTDSFAALARMYERQYRTQRDWEPAPRLYLTRLETGSIIAEIAPYVVMMSGLVATMGGANTIGDFVKRLSYGIRAFSDPTAVKTDPPPPKPETFTLPESELILQKQWPSKADMSDIRAFVRPLTGKAGAALNIKHARLTRSETPEGGRHTVLAFNEFELNRAAINIDHALSSVSKLDNDVEALLEPRGESISTEVMLFFEQASRGPGRERGRTGDRGIVPEVSSKPLPVYFRKSFLNLKDQMVRGDTNPLTDNAFIVDVYVHRDEDGEPRAYYVTGVHRIVPLDPCN